MISIDEIDLNSPNIFLPFDKEYIGNDELVLVKDEDIDKR